MMEEGYNAYRNRVYVTTLAKSYVAPLTLDSYEP